MSKFSSLTIAIHSLFSYVFDDDDFVILSLGESEEEEFPPVNPAHKIAYEHRFNRRMAKYAARKANRAPPCGGSVDGVNIKPNMGANKWRRIENARILASFCDPSDIRYDCSDLIVETVSVFRRLMENEESMRVWNEFIEKDEKEQQTFLKELEDGINDISFCDDLETSSDEKRARKSLAST
jgi:hypothetical protein